MAESVRPRAAAARISVVYALPDRQEIVKVALEPGLDVQTAVQRSGLLLRFPQAAATPLVCAIYGQPAALTREVRAGDRIEILRPLLIDPKEGRRQAARAQRAARRR
jgi:putative ubiquitin-RnfH superfamily antitoxin RatB of RatAB toxin-antitoxin module